MRVGIRDVLDVLDLLALLAVGGKLGLFHF